MVDASRALVIDARADDRDFVATRGTPSDVGPGDYVGYSQGGRLCLQLALDRPTSVHRLVLVSASPGIADADDRAARVDADERLAQEIERDGVDAFLERWLAQPLFATLPRERAGLDERRAGQHRRVAHRTSSACSGRVCSRRTGTGSASSRCRCC